MANPVRNLNLGTKANARYEEEVTFKGVDYANPRLMVTDGHALDEKNYLYRNNSIQKRYGFDSYATTEDFYYFSVDAKNNKVDSSENDDHPWSEDEYGTVKHGDPIYDLWFFNDCVIVHKGAMLFYMNLGEIGKLIPVAYKNTTKIKNEKYAYTTIEVPRRRLNAFMGNKKLWILTGVLFMCLEGCAKDGFKFYSVTEQGNPYIPTTTIGITQSEAMTGGERTTYEPVNMLTEMRTNGFVGGIPNNSVYGSNVFTYTLDGKVDTSDIDRNEERFNVAISSPNIEIMPAETQYENSDFILPCLPRSATYRYTSNGFKFTRYFGGINDTTLALDLEGMNIVLNDNNRTILTPSETNIEFPTSRVIVKNNMVYTEKTERLYSVSPNTTDEDKKWYDEGKYYYSVWVKNEGDDNFSEVELTDKFGCRIPSGTVLIGLFARLNNRFYYCTYMISDNSAGDDYTEEAETNPISVFDYAGNVNVVKKRYSAGSTSLRGSSYIYTENLFMSSALGHKTSLDINSKVGSDTDVAIGKTSCEITKTGEYSNELKLLAYLGTESGFGKNKAILNGGGWPFGSDEGYLLIDKSNFEQSDSFDGLELKVNPENASVYGYISYDKTKIILFINPTGNSVGESNIKVTYPAVIKADENGFYPKDNINKCTFGTLFGTLSARNRLFVSGNDECPNFDWHTGENDENGEFDYFPDTSYCAYGQNSNKVVGYGIVSDGKLMVIKDTSDKEPSVYYRTATYTAVKDDSGNALTTASGDEMIDESYPLTMTNSHIGGVDNHMFADFNGDSLFVDEHNRVVGLDNEGTTYDNQRVASTRSFYIDNELKKTPLTEMASRGLLIADKDELLLATPDDLWYSHFDLKYEWFRLGVPNVVSFCHPRYENSYDFKLFGTYDGRIIKPFVPTLNTTLGRFTERFTDDENVALADGSYIDNGAFITISGDVKSMIDDGYKVSAGSFVRVDQERHSIVMVLEPGSTNTYVYITSSKDIITDGTYYTENDTEISLEMIDPMSYEDYRITDFSKNWYLVKKDELYYSFYLYQKMSSEAVFDSEQSVDGEYGLLVNGLHVSKFLTEPILKKKTNVSAYYVTSPYLTSSMKNTKVIDMYKIIADAFEPSEIFVKMATDRISLDEITQKDTNSVGSSVNYSDVNYGAVDYMRYTLPHTTTLYGRFVGEFIALRLFSPGATNSTLTQMRFIYHLGRVAYGKN